MIPGALDYTALAIAMSPITWCAARVDLYTSKQGYTITRQGENPPYWTGYSPGGCDPSRELAAGAGNLGLAKCIRRAERHLEEVQASALPTKSVPTS
jgi:hypothetical protein